MLTRSVYTFVTACLVFAIQMPLQAAEWKDVELSGYFSFEYEKNVGGDKNGDTNGSFDLDLIDLVFNFQATDRLRIATDLTWEHGSASEDGRGNVAVEYAFAEYTVQNWLRVKTGKMFTNFGIYNEIHTAKPATLTVKEPLSTNKNNKLGSSIRFYPRWLTGLAIQGDSNLSDMPFNYDIQLSNGETDNDGENPFEEDNNNHKAFNGRMIVELTDNFKVGASFYTDKMTNIDDNGDFVSNTDVNSYGIQAEWMSGSNSYGLEFEYVAGDVDDSSLGSTKINRSAYTFMAYFLPSEKYTPYIRYEFLDPNTDIDDDAANLIIVGINIEIDSNMYLKLEVDNISTEPGNAKFSGDDYSEFKASLSVGY